MASAKNYKIEEVTKRGTQIYVAEGNYIYQKDKDKEQSHYLNHLRYRDQGRAIAQITIGVFAETQTQNHASSAGMSKCLS